MEQARQIGNAVPVRLAEQLGASILAAHAGQPVRYNQMKDEAGQKPSCGTSIPEYLDYLDTREEPVMCKKSLCNHFKQKYPCISNNWEGHNLQRRFDMPSDDDDDDQIKACAICSLQMHLDDEEGCPFAYQPNLEDIKREPGFALRQEIYTLYTQGVRDFNERLKSRALQGANLSGLPLQFADFSELDLSNVNFRDTLLAGAKFRHAKMRKANFNGANVTMADFERATLCHAVFNDANISGAVGLQRD